jgi:hypothetical protein
MDENWLHGIRKLIRIYCYTGCTSKFVFLNLLTPTLSSRRGSKGAEF